MRVKSSEIIFLKICIFLLTISVLIPKYEAKSADDLEEKWDLCAPKDPQEYPKVCKIMAPRNGIAGPQDVSKSPWKIYTQTSQLQQYFTREVVLGSDSSKVFDNYIIVARAIDTGQIVGHWEHQWDAIPVCCYEKGRDYSYEGPKLHPVNNN